MCHQHLESQFGNPSMKVVSPAARAGASGGNSSGKPRRAMMVIEQYAPLVLLVSLILRTSEPDVPDILFSTNAHGKSSIGLLALAQEMPSSRVNNTVYPTKVRLSQGSPIKATQCFWSNHSTAKHSAICRKHVAQVPIATTDASPWILQRLEKLDHSRIS